MRALYVVILISAVFGGANGQETSRPVAYELAQMDDACKFSIPSESAKKIVSAATTQRSATSYQLSLTVALNPHSTTLTGRAVFACMSSQPTEAQSAQGHRFEDSSALRTQAKSPREVIQDEDSGGRYFRHVAWEKKFPAENWPAVVAFSDYVFGDGRKSKTDFFLVCHATAPIPCFSFEVNQERKLTKNDKLQIIAFIRKISFQE